MKVFQSLTILFDLFCFCKFHQWLWLWALPICPLSIPSRWSDIHLHRVSGRFQSWALRVFSNTFGFLSKQPFDQQKLGTQLPNASRTFPDTLPIGNTRKHWFPVDVGDPCPACCVWRIHSNGLLLSKIITSLPVGKGKNVQGYAALGGQVRFGPGNASQENVFPLWLELPVLHGFRWISSVSATHLVMAGFRGFWTKAGEQIPWNVPCLDSTQQSETW